jgi:3-deoxy-D-manno-octulosonic-acid transferase
MRFVVMYFFYNTALILLTVFLSPLITVILLLRRKYRCGFFQKCGLLPWQHIKSKLKSPPIWIHAVSVGEVMAAIPLIKEIRKRYPDVPILLSTVTETGHFTAQRNATSVDHVMYFPFDYPFIVRRMVAKIKPRIFVALEAEIWPNLLQELNRQGVPSMIISGRISRDSFKQYYLFRFFFKKVLAHMTRFCMQSRTDAERIINMGAIPEKVIVTGNIKFDQQLPAITPEEKARIYKEIKINSDQNIFIAGSTHKGEEEIIIEVYRALKKKICELVLILAPRHPDRFDEVEDLLKQAGIPYIRKTTLMVTSDYGSPEVILLDTIGELAKIYSIGTIVFIGGSLVPIGGHNVLEPAVFSKPVIFGNFMDNFSEISHILKEKKAAIQISNKDDLIKQSMSLLEDPELCKKIGETVFTVIMENSGALKRSMDFLGGLLEQ